MSLLSRFGTLLSEIDDAFDHARTGRRPVSARPPEVDLLPPELRADIGWPDACSAHNFRRGDSNACRR